MKNAANRALVIALLALVVFFAGRLLLKYANETRALKEVIARLEADSRAAEALVTGVNFDGRNKKLYTTIKFLEYGADGNALEPRYFTFSGNIIQFQSLVIRFDDIHVRGGNRLRSKSAYLFWKAFALDGENTQEYEITKAEEVPPGYKIKGARNKFEEGLWKKFWKYALDPAERHRIGVKNAQIEAPGSMFIPGVLYTIKIEHDGGLRIDASPLPEILKGERIPG